MIDLTVKTLDSLNHAFSLEDDQITVRGFKEHIAESVAVPADSQRLIYCGRVLQDEKKLNDYDVNGKVIHLVQRAPPQPGQRGNDGGQGQGQGHGQSWQNMPRTHYRFTRGQMHGNAMYLGAMSVPAEIVEGHGLPVSQLNNSFSNIRVVVARRMLDRANELVDRLSNTSVQINPLEEEPPFGQPVRPQEEAEQEVGTSEGRAGCGARCADAAACSTTSDASHRGSTDEGTEARSAPDATDENQSDTQQSQSEPQGSTSGNTRSSINRMRLVRPIQMADLLRRLHTTHYRLRPYMERYLELMREDPALNPGGGPNSVEENQRIVDTVSEALHCMSHACHALSDVIVDMGQQPPRYLRSRATILQHSAILQPGIPIQVEAHISLHGRNANNNNGTDESGESGSATAPSDSAETNAEDTSQQQEPESSGQQPPDGQQQPQQSQQRDQPPQSPFVFNLPNNVEVLMEVSPESNLEAPSGSEQAQGGENNNNNNNAGRMTGAAAAFPWGSAPPPDFIRNLMQAVAGHMAGHITTTTITTQNPPPAAGGQQPIVTSLDSGNTNAGQSTQARSNVGTHPTTATQTRSTSRPHVFHHQQAHPLGVGMSIGQGFEFDPFLPCNSHHIRPSSATPNIVTLASQGTSRPSQTPAAETQSQTQTATTSTTTSNTSSTNTTASTTSQTTTNNTLVNLLQQMFAGASGGQPQASISINSNNGDLTETLGNIMQIVSGRNVHVGIVGERGDNTATGGNITLADLLEISMDLITPQESGNEDNFLVNLSVLVAQHLTLGGLIRSRVVHWEPIAQLRRPVHGFFVDSFPGLSPVLLRKHVTDRLITQLRPHLQNLLATEEDAGGRSSSRIDICATVENILRQHIIEALQLLFNTYIDDDIFGREMLWIVNRLGRQLCAVLRYSIRGGQAGLEAVASRFMTVMLVEGTYPVLRQWILNGFIDHFRSYSLRVQQPPDSEILPLLIYRDAPRQGAGVSSTASQQQPPQAPVDTEPMEVEVVQERSNFPSAVPDDEEEIPETFPGHEALPSTWVPIIARDGVRQRRQLQMQGMANSDVATFSDAYLGALPTKRRKLIEQQKPRLLVSPTPNHSAIAASMERLVREGVTRAGVEEVDGAAIAVAVDPGVRRAFGQAIRDCLNPRRYGTSDFPDPLRFPNASKYFADQERPPKQ